MSAAAQSEGWLRRDERHGFVRLGRMKVFALVVANAALCALLIAGCGGTNHTAAAKLTAVRVPNPFRIVARYSASSLGLKDPRDLAIGPDGNLYITDATDRVTVVSPAGKILRRWGKQGARPGEFSFAAVDPLDRTDIAASIAVGPGGKVYVSDSGNARIEIFSPTGTFLRKMGAFGTGNGQFILPYDLATDASGNVYVADERLSTVSKLSPDGRPLWQVGGNTTSAPDLQGEIHLTSRDSHGRLVASSDSQQAIVYVDSAGHEVDSFHTTGDFREPGVGPCDVTVDGAGYTFVTSCGISNTKACGGYQPAPCSLHVELVFDRTHQLVGAWYHTSFLSDPGLSPRFGPRGEAFAIGADGSILKLKVDLRGA
jgi:DNA-binding beta-propeller fold protein YncE